MTSNDDFDLTVHADDCPADALETECLGHYDTLDDYLRTTVDPLFLPEGTWLLDCLVLDRVRGHLESSGVYRLRIGAGRVFRDRLRSTSNSG